MLKCPLILLVPLRCVVFCHQIGSFSRLKSLSFLLLNKNTSMLTKQILRYCIAWGFFFSNIKVISPFVTKPSMVAFAIHVRQEFMVLWSGGRHLASGSGCPGFESWLCQVDFESLGKALYMHFLTPLMCKKSTQL